MIPTNTQPACALYTRKSRFPRLFVSLLQGRIVGSAKTLGYPSRPYNTLQYDILQNLQRHPALCPPQPKLTQPNPRHNPDEDQDTSHHNRPMLHVQHIQRIRRPAGRANRRQTEHGNQIAGQAMILVDALCPVHTAIQTGHVVLREPNERLHVHEHVEGESESCVRRGKVLVARPGLVHLDDDETRSEGRDADEVQGEVGDGARPLLLGCVRGLEDEGCLDGEEEAGGVEKGMSGEEDEFVG